MSHTRKGISLLVSCALVFLRPAATLKYPQHLQDGHTRLGHTSDPRVCVVIRTYWAHSGPDGLRALIKSLQRQTLQEWEAVLLVLDGKPFEELAEIVQELSDDRVWTFAEWIGVQFTPQASTGWTAGYHHQLYNLTDEAIRACPSSTSWVVVTNGDNEYADTLFQTLLQSAPDEDIVALDYYSRYQRPTGPPCERFAAEEGLPPCKTNKMQWCHTDLGANILKWPRMMAEDRRFGTLQDQSGGLSAEHYDGVMMMSLLSAGWKARRVEDSCLFEHSPSPQRCARLGGAWDESGITPDSPVGGTCVSVKQADQLTLSYGKLVEELQIVLSSDGALDAFEGGMAGNETSIRCLRKADVKAQHGEYMRYFGPYCAAEADMDVFESHLLAQNMEDLDDQRAEWATQQAFAQRKPSRLKPPKPPPRDAKPQPSFRRRLPAHL